MAKNTLTAYWDDDGECLRIYDDSRVAHGDPMLEIWRDSFLTLAQFLILAYEDPLSAEEVNLRGSMRAIQREE